MNVKRFLRTILGASIPINIAFFGLILFALLVVFPSIPVEVFPNISFRQAQVSLRYPGASADEVERLVTRPVEDAIRGLEATEYVASTSVPGRSEVVVKFADDADHHVGYDQFRFRVLSVLNSLPQVNGKILQPHFSELDVDSWVPVIQVMLVNSDSGNLNKRALTLLAKELRDRLEQIPGVKRIDFAGDEFDQFLVSIDPAKLDRHGVTLAEVLLAISAHGGTLPAGDLDTELGERFIRIDTRPREASDVLGVVVKSVGDGAFVTVADLVNPEETGISAIRETVGNSLDGRESIGCRILKDKAANAKTVRDDVLQVIDEFRISRKDLPFEIHAILDSTRKINESMAVLHDSLMLALGLVVASLFFFLSKRGWASSGIALLLTVISTAVVASSQDTTLEILALGSLALFVFFACRAAVLTVSGILFSFLGTLIVFHSMGNSINEITLIGFVLTVGIIVDDAIIVLENIRRQRELGKGLRDSIVDGVSEVFVPICSATLTTIAAFLPMLLMTGTVGDVFTLLPISVSIALGVSLIECLVILPVHIGDLDRILGPEEVDQADVHDGVEAYLSRPGFTGKLSRFYDKVFLWNQANGIRVLLLAALLFLAAIGIVVQSWFGPTLGMRPMLKLVFFPEDTSILHIAVNTEPGTSLNQTDEIVRQLSRELRETGLVEVAVGLSGMKLDTTYRPQFSHQFGLVMAEFPIRSERVHDNPNDAIEVIRQKLQQRWLEKDVRIEVTGQKDGPPVGSPVTVRIQGRDSKGVDEISRRVYQLLSDESQPGGRLEGVVDLASDLDQESHALTFIPNEQQMAVHGIEPGQVRTFIAGAFDGVYVGDFLRSDDEIPIRVRFHQDATRDPTSILGLPVARGSDTGVLRFAEIGTIEGANEPGILRRRHFQRSVNITGNLAPDAIINSDTVSFVIDEAMGDEVRSRPGVSFSFEGEAQSTTRSFETLFVSFWIAVFVIYLILSAQFSSVFHPFVILSNVAFSFTGVVLVMALLALFSDVLPGGWVREERSYITVSAFIAVVGLTGIVVNDAIVLVDFIQRRRKEGMPLDVALRMAGHERMRPILMTTISTIAGLLPMAIGIPHFDVRWSPFATVFVAGLMVATVMTLLVVPVLYRYSHRFHEALKAPEREVDSQS